MKWVRLTSCTALQDGLINTSSNRVERITRLSMLYLPSMCPLLLLHWRRRYVRLARRMSLSKTDRRTLFCRRSILPLVAHITRLLPGTLSLVAISMNTSQRYSQTAFLASVTAMSSDVSSICITITCSSCLWLRKHRLMLRNRLRYAINSTPRLTSGSPTVIMPDSHCWLSHSWVRMVRSIRASRL